MMIEISEIVDRIRRGYAAEKTLKKRFEPTLFQLAREKHKLTEAEAAATAKRAVAAGVNSVRRTREWDESVFQKMLGDQILIRKFNNNEISEPVFAKLRMQLKRLQFYRRLPDRVLDDVVSETLARFAAIIRQPSFELSSRLVTFLNGIADNVVVETCRAYDSPFGTSGQKASAGTFAYSADYLNVFYEANRLVFEKLSDMDDVCHNLIISYYRIVPEQVMRTDRSSRETAPELYTYDELESLFNVSVPRHFERLTLEKVAENLGLNPKQIRKRHAACLSKLLKATASELNERVGEQLMTEVLADIRARKNYIKRRNKRQ